MVVFAAMHAVPGDPAAMASWSTETGEPGAGLEARVARFRAEHLLDQPLWKQYLHFLGPFDLSAEGSARFGGSGRHPWHGVLALDCGSEFQRPSVRVADELARRLEVTAPLALCAILLAYGVAVPLGILSAARRGSLADHLGSGLLFLLHSLPAFWTG